MAAVAVLVLVAACSSAATTAPTAAPTSAATAAPTAAPATGVSDKAKQVTFPWGEFKLAQRIIDKAAKGEPLNIVSDISGTAIPIFGAEQLIGTERGCETAKTDFNVACRLTGPTSTDTNAQLAELETLLKSDQVDCLTLHSPGPDAFVDIINQFVEAGIPVFTENTDVPSSKRFAFFAINEFNAGKQNGTATANLVKARNLSINMIAGGSGGPDEPWAQDRYRGFIEGYKSVIPDAKFFNDEKGLLPAGMPDYTVKTTIDQVAPFLTGHPDVNLFFHTDQGVEGLGTIISTMGFEGKVWTSGFNVSFPILDSMDAGNTLVTVNQGFDNQTEAAVLACRDFLKDGKYPADPLAYLDGVVVTKDGGEGQQTSAQQREHLKLVAGG
jgi:ribose transport system substrate-binding protein